jgi:hypothetical protein
MDFKHRFRGKTTTIPKTGDIISVPCTPITKLIPTLPLLSNDLETKYVNLDLDSIRMINIVAFRASQQTFVTLQMTDPEQIKS